MKYEASAPQARHEQNQFTKCPILNAKQFEKISIKTRTIYGLSSTSLQIQAHSRP
jgi:hypothetical protein